MNKIKNYLITVGVSASIVASTLGTVFADYTGAPNSVKGRFDGFANKSYSSSVICRDKEKASGIITCSTNFYMVTRWALYSSGDLWISADTPTDILKYCFVYGRESWTKYANEVKRVFVSREFFERCKNDNYTVINNLGLNSRNTSVEIY